MKVRVLMATALAVCLSAFGQSETCWGTAETCGSWSSVESAYPLGIFSNNNSSPFAYNNYGFHGEHEPITNLGSCFQHCEDYAEQLVNKCLALMDNDQSQFMNYETVCSEQAEVEFGYCISDCIVVGRSDGGL